MIAAYNCCRSPIRYHERLASACRRGGEELPEVEGDSPYVKYYYIKACPPGGIADLNDDFALKLKEKFAEAAV